MDNDSSGLRHCMIGTLAFRLALLSLFGLPSIVSAQGPSAPPADNLTQFSVRYATHDFGIGGVLTEPSSMRRILSAAAGDRELADKLGWTEADRQRVKKSLHRDAVWSIDISHVPTPDNVGTPPANVRASLSKLLNAEKRADLDYLALMLDGFVVLRRQRFVELLDLKKPQIAKIDSLIDRCFKQLVNYYVRNRFAEVKMTIDDERIWASELTKASVRLNLDIVDVLTEAQKTKLLREIKAQSALDTAAKLVRLHLLQSSEEKQRHDQSQKEKM